jgi:DNA polymerase-3 subunit alpha
LHTHTDYSLLDGASQIPDVVKKVAEDGAPALGITDHGSMGGIGELVRAAKAAGITPIPGMEAYHSTEMTRHAPEPESPKSYFHLTLLGINNAGYHNLLKMSSEANMNGFFYKPRLDDALMSQHSDGVVALSGCLGSRFNQALLREDFDLAKQVLSDHKDIFGERFFIEVMDHDIADQKIVAPYHVKFSKELGIPMVATNDSHYTHESEAHMHDALLCAGTKAKLSDAERFRFHGHGHYVRSAEEMMKLFPNEQYKDACSNTLLIAEMAKGFDLRFNDPQDYLIPKFPFDDPATDAKDELRRQVMIGAQRHYANESGRIPEKVQERIDYELDVINTMHFNDYFHIVGDMIQWGKSQGIAIGPGRGSAGGSVVAFCLSITMVDPIKYGLYFERFLNPGRISMPDIDVDIEPARRQDMIQYIVRKYGAERVAQISTYGKVKAKSGLLSAARVQGRTPADGARLSLLWPGVIAQAEADMPTILSHDEPPAKFKEHWERGADLRDAYEGSAEDRSTIDLAMQMQGIRSQTGIHAAGVLITPTAVSNYFPLRKDKKSEMPISSYNLGDAEGLGGLKMDLLGLKNLAVIKTAIRRIKDDLGKEVNIDNIPLDDKKVFKMLSEGETDGVFQLESPGMRKLLMMVKPTEFEDISAVLALYRPGPMGSNLHTMYAEVKNGLRAVDVPHDDMLDLMKDSLGVLCYQEQLISLATHYAGFTISEADNFRKATGKKDAVKLAQQEVAFKERSVERGFDAKVIGEIWDLIPPFAAYGFNKSHSVAYGMVTYQTAWLKANYAAQYIAACLDYMRKDQIPILVNVARDQRIEVYPPNINKSGFDTTTADGNIWLSMSGIKGCGGKTLESIIAVRDRGGEFKSLHDFLERTAGSKLSIAAIKSLIQAGSFDMLHGSRKLMLENVAEMKDVAKGTDTNDEDDLFGDLDVDSRMDNFVLEGKDYTDNEKSKMEQEVLGFFTGRHPYLTIMDNMDLVDESGFVAPGSVAIDDRKVADGASGLDIFGVISAAEASTTKSGKPMLKFTLDNGQGVRLDGIHFGFISNFEVGNFVCLKGDIAVDTIAMENALNAMSHDEDGDDDEADGTAAAPVEMDAPPLIFRVKAGRAIDIDKLLGGSYKHDVRADDEFTRERQKRQSSGNRGGGGGGGRGGDFKERSTEKPWEKGKLKAPTRPGSTPRAEAPKQQSSPQRTSRPERAAEPRTQSRSSSAGARATSSAPKDDSRATVASSKNILRITFESTRDVKAFMKSVQFSDGDTSVRIKVNGEVYDYGKLITVPRSVEKLEMIADAFSCSIEHGGKLLAEPRS